MHKSATCIIKRVSNETNHKVFKLLVYEGRFKFTKSLRVIYFSIFFYLSNFRNGKCRVQFATIFNNRAKIYVVKFAEKIRRVINYDSKNKLISE